MKQRCYNENSTAFISYGAKGVAICDEWLKDSTSFYLWAIENGYADDLSIDRVDPKLGYFPDNCRWITLSENTTRMLVDNFNNSSGQFDKDSITKLTETNRDRLGRSLVLIDNKGNETNFRCLIEAAEYIVKEKCLQTHPVQIKKNLSACLQGKRKTCHGYKVLQVGDPYQEF